MYKSGTYPTYDVPIYLFFPECPYTLVLFSAIVPPHPVHNTSTIRLYVDVSISLSVAHTQDFCSADTDTCKSALPYKVKIFRESIDCLPMEFSVPVRAYPINQMNGYSPCFPPLQVHRIIVVTNTYSTYCTQWSTLHTTRVIYSLLLHNIRQDTSIHGLLIYLSTQSLFLWYLSATQHSN